VLTHLVLDERDEEHRACVLCDTIVDTHAYSADADELERRGYVFLDLRAKCPCRGCKDS